MVLSKNLSSTASKEMNLHLPHWQGFREMSPGNSKQFVMDAALINCTCRIHIENTIVSGPGRPRNCSKKTVSG